MKLLEGIEAIDLAIWIPKHKIAVFADFHIGYEEELNKKGVLVPRFNYKNVLDRLEMIFSKIKPNIIVINGDLKHEFGTISRQEWRDAMRMLDYLSRKCDKIILIRGNHDTILGPIADKKNISIVDNYVVDDILITHGHKITKSNKIVIIGHEHPAVALHSDVRVERFKCFLVGKNLIVQPSFNLLTEGTDVLSEKLLSPFLKDISKFKVFVVDEKKKEILKFGNVKDLRKYMLE